MTETDAKPKSETQIKIVWARLYLVHVGAFTLLFPYKCTPARKACWHEASIQTLRMRRRENMKKPIREKFLFGLTLNVREKP